MSDRAHAVIENPFSGERIVIRKDAIDTAGRLLEFDLFLPPRAHVPARHAHPLQEERFTVIDGTIRFRMGRRDVDAHRGDTVVVPPRTSHWFGNAGDSVAHARVEARPALRLEELFAATQRVGRRGRGRLAIPRVTDLALLLSDYRDEVRSTGAQAVLTVLVLAPLARLVKRHRASRSR